MQTNNPNRVPYRKTLPEPKVRDVFMDRWPEVVVMTAIVSMVMWVVVLNVKTFLKISEAPLRTPPVRSEQIEKMEKRFNDPRIDPRINNRYVAE